MPPRQAGGQPLHPIYPPKDAVPEPLAALLSAGEQQASRVRAQALADYARFPEDRSGQRYPWPLV